MQLAAFTALPSLLLQSGPLAQRDADETQNKPLDKSQLFVPHVQLPGLIAVPSLLLQAGTVSHLFNADTQNNPLEAAVQSLVPQTQLSELTELPSTTEHGG